MNRNKMYSKAMENLRIVGYWETATVGVVLVNKHYMFSKHHRMVDVMLCAASRPILHEVTEDQRAVYDGTFNEINFYPPSKEVIFKARKFQRRSTLKQWAGRMWKAKTVKVPRMEVEYRGYKALGCVVFDAGEQVPLLYLDFEAEYSTHGEGSNFIVNFKKPLMSISPNVM